MFKSQNIMNTINTYIQVGNVERPMFNDWIVANGNFGNELLCFECLQLMIFVFLLSSMSNSIYVSIFEHMYDFTFFEQIEVLFQDVVSRTRTFSKLAYAANPSIFVFESCAF